jgi:hypothetical protein
LQTLAAANARPRDGFGRRNGASTSGLRTGAAAGPLVDAEWSLEPGNPIPGHQVPARYAKNIVRALANPNFEPRTKDHETLNLGSMTAELKVGQWYSSVQR